MSDDLFSNAATESGAAQASAPLAVRMRPRSLDEVRGQGDVLRQGSPLRRLVEGAQGAAGPVSAILWGPPGTGKTTLAHLVARAGEHDRAGERTSGGEQDRAREQNRAREQDRAGEPGGAGREAGPATPRRAFVELSAINAGVKDVRAVMDQAARDRDLYGRQTVLFLDEIHRFSKAQQDALLPGVENRLVVLVAATTENPSFSVISPLMSRSILVRLQSLSDDDVAALIDAALTESRGLAGRFALADDAKAQLVRLSGGDARAALTALEAAAGVAEDVARQGGSAGSGSGGSGSGGSPVPISLETLEQALAVAAVRYDRAGDQHYDVASALIKSMRGSDVDAALHYLARMLEAGEDPRFIARRIVIAASEDVGMADPTALQTAVAAMHAVAQIGMPEARIVLAQAVVHNALAPKSNASYSGINAAIADVRAGKGGAVPVHLRGSSYSGAEQLGHGKGYRYSHDEPGGVGPQQFLPDDLAEVADYYHPTDRGWEERIGPRWTTLRRTIRGETQGRPQDND